MLQVLGREYFPNVQLNRFVPILSNIEQEGLLPTQVGFYYDFLILYHLNTYYRAYVFGINNFTVFIASRK